MKYVRGMLVILVGLLCLASSCPPHVYTPPTRLWPEETSPKPLAKGGSAVSITGGWAGTFEIFDGWSTGSGSLAYHRGLFDGMEGGLSASYLRVVQDKYTLNVEPQAFNLRTSVKAAPPALNRFVSARCGLGWGMSQAGQYWGLDCGLNLGWHNPYVVPFVSGGYYVSIPVTARDVIFMPGPHDSGSTQVYSDKFQTTYGFEWCGGLKAYIISKERRNPDRFSLSVFAVYKLTVLYTEPEFPEYPTSIGGGAEMEF